MNVLRVLRYGVQFAHLYRSRGKVGPDCLARRIQHWIVGQFVGKYIINRHRQVRDGKYEIEKTHQRYKHTKSDKNPVMQHQMETTENVWTNSWIIYRWMEFITRTVGSIISNRMSKEFMVLEFITYDKVIGVRGECYLHHCTILYIFRKWHRDSQLSPEVIRASEVSWDEDVQLLI